MSPQSDTFPISKHNIMLHCIHVYMEILLAMGHLLSFLALLECFWKKVSKRRRPIY